jgi:hypothetical protein
MKKIHIYSIILSVLLGTSCTDVLDKTPAGDNLSLEEIYADPELVEALLAKCYAGIPEKGASGWVYEDPWVAGSDDGWASGDNWGGYQSCDLYGDRNRADYAVMAGNFVCPASDGMVSWNRSYQQIHLVNQFIGDADKMTFNANNPKDKLVAEAYVLRAYFYLDLMKNWGAVPLFLETLPIDFDYTTLKRTPPYEVAQAVIADCNTALDMGTLPWRQTSPNEAIRATNALAWAIKSTAILFAASPLYNGGEDHWDEAYTICKAAVIALENNGYKLFTNAEADKSLFGDYDAAAYHQLFCQSATDQTGLTRDKETIFQHVQGALGHGGRDNNAWMLNYVGNWDGAYQAGVCPTQELVDAYDVLSADGTKAEPLLDLSNPYGNDEHTTVNYNDAALSLGYNPNDPYAARRDPRMRATVLKNGDEVVWSNGEVKYVDAYEGAPDEGVENGLLAILAGWQGYAMQSNTGYYSRKYVTPGASPTNQVHESPYKQWRLAEMYLNLAEAALEANQTGDALTYVNKTRERVNMPRITETDKEKLRMRIRNERRVEFALEDQRYFDLRRWTSPTGDLGAYHKYLTAMHVYKHADGTFTYERKQIWSIPRGGWTNRDLFCPIPLAEANRMEVITGEKWQNPGW